MTHATWWTAALPWVFGIGVLLASVRLLFGVHRQDPATRARGWRIGLLLFGQLASATLLLLLLRTPDPGDAVHTLHLSTARAPAKRIPIDRPGERWLRLPEAFLQAGVARIPDLATALRQHPQVRALHVIGDGLELRDLEAAAGLRIDFERAIPLPGITDWWSPQWLHAGDVLHVRGTAHAPSGARIELLDPAGQRVDMQRLQDDGGFALQAGTRSPGIADYRLRLSAGNDRVIETTRVPVQVLATTPTKLLLRSGGPDPELKYLRRWAADSGARLRASIELGGGMQAGDAPVGLDARTLADTDVLIMDDRSWNALGTGRRAAVLAAVGKGMGLVLRATAPLADSASLGLQVRSAALPPTYRVASMGQPALPLLDRPQWRLVNASGRTLLRDDRGAALAGWRAHGRGRIAVWLPTDTFRLALAGHAAVHARQWASAINAVARPRATMPGKIPLLIHAGTRTVFCELGDAARVVAPGQTTSLQLAVDPRSGARRCAAYWPATPGWHRLLDVQGERPFLVRGNDEDKALRAALVQSATAALSAKPASNRIVTATTIPAFPRWLLLLAWLAVTTALWWFERTRFGRVRPSSPG